MVLVYNCTKNFVFFIELRIESRAIRIQRVFSGECAMCSRTSTSCSMSFIEKVVNELQ
jgi:hypothetical protein